MVWGAGLGGGGGRGVGVGVAVLGCTQCVSFKLFEYVWSVLVLSVV